MTISTLFHRMASELAACENTYHISKNTKNWLLAAPIIIIFIQIIFWLPPATRNWCVWMLQENHPVEVLTFILLLAASIYSLHLSVSIKNISKSGIIPSLYLIFSIASFLVAGEEIAWGQQFIGFKAPAAWDALNVKGETTIHNLRGLDGNTEILRLIFGVGGIASLFIPARSILNRIRMPVVILPWLVVIVIHSVIDFYNDIIPINDGFDYFISKTAELIELLIAASALLYVKLNRRMILGA